MTVYGVVGVDGIVGMVLYGQLCSSMAYSIGTGHEISHDSYCFYS